MNNKTNLQRFAELYKDEEGINEFILENFNNQDSDKYEFNGTEYLIFTANDVQDALDEDFEWELIELIDELQYGRSSEFSHLAGSIERAVTIDYNYKDIRSDFDNLREYYFEASDETIYVYTKK